MIRRGRLSASVVLWAYPFYLYIFSVRSGFVLLVPSTTRLNSFILFLQPHLRQTAVVSWQGFDPLVSYCLFALFLSWFFCIFQPSIFIFLDSLFAIFLSIVSLLTRKDVLIEMKNIIRVVLFLHLRKTGEVGAKYRFRG